VLSFNLQGMLIPLEGEKHPATPLGHEAAEPGVCFYDRVLERNHQGIPPVPPDWHPNLQVPF